MTRNEYIWAGIILLSATVVSAGVLLRMPKQRPLPPAARQGSVFTYSFKIPGTLEEAGSLEESTSPYWWVNSGGALLIRDGMGMTLEGELPHENPWRQQYAQSNSLDTDNGTHPQNVFRLISKSVWETPRIEASMYIVQDRLSESPNRNESNGLLLISGYALDDQILYYAGVRVDGHAVIKKKYNGKYYTLAEKPVFPGIYNREANPNLLPKNEWIRLRSETTRTDGVLTIALYMKRESDTEWKELVRASDRNKPFDRTPIIDAGYVGIRTDFMDVRFKDIRIEEL